MPTYASGGYINGLDAGTQVSSTNEGRHIEIEEQDMVHAGAALVAKGTPVLFNDLTADAMTAVGVALGTATAITDFIAVDTEGIWNLSVVSSSDITGAVANDDIVFGDQIFINITTGVLSKIRNANTNRPFGYSVNTTTVAGAGTASVLPVKVHWDPYWSEVVVPLVGADGAEYADTNATGCIFREFHYTSSATSGNARGMYIRTNCTGQGTTQYGGIRSQVDVQDVRGSQGYALYGTINFNTSGDATGEITGVKSEVVVSAKGQTTGSYHGAIAAIHYPANAALNNVPHSLHAFHQTGNAAARQISNCVFHFAGLSTGANKQFETKVEAATHLLRCSVEGATMWILMTNTNAT